MQVYLFLRQFQRTKENIIQFWHVLRMNENIARLIGRFQLARIHLGKISFSFAGPNSTSWTFKFQLNFTLPHTLGKSHTILLLALPYPSLKEALQNSLVLQVAKLPHNMSSFPIQHKNPSSQEINGMLYIKENQTHTMLNYVVLTNNSPM